MYYFRFYIKKNKKHKQLLLTEAIIACVDVLCLLIAGLSLSWKGLLISYIIMGINSVLGDPVWGSIISAYSTNKRSKYVFVNKIYFVIRAIFTLITWFICRECVIRGEESFKYLAIVLIILIIITFVISNKVNKKVFGSSI